MTYIKRHYFFIGILNIMNHAGLKVRKNIATDEFCDPARGKLHVTIKALANHGRLTLNIRDGSRLKPY